MNTYAITLWNHTTLIPAETASKAKYRFFIEHEIGDSVEFKDFLMSVGCKLYHKFTPKDLFCENDEMFNYMKEQRNIPFVELGMRVEVDGKPGVIVGYYGLNLNVCFDGEYQAINCHPWWRTKYFDRNGNLIREYGE